LSHSASTPPFFFVLCHPSNPWPSPIGSIPWCLSYDLRLRMSFSASAYLLSAGPWIASLFPEWLGRTEMLCPLCLPSQLLYVQGSGNKDPYPPFFPLKKLSHLFQTSSSASLFCSPLTTEYVKSFLYIKSLKRLLVLATWFQNVLIMHYSQSECWLLVC
jgi:hypothetical protein